MSFDKHKLDLWDLLWDYAIGGLAIIAEDGTFERVNPAFCRIVEYSEVELQQMKFQDITMPTDVEPDVELANQVRRGDRKSYDMIKSYMTKTRRVVWVHLRVVGVEMDGEFHYFLSQIFEIPVTAVSQMGIDPKAQLNHSKPFPWGKVFRFMKEWIPWIAFVAGLFIAGLGVLAGWISPPPPPPI